MIETKGKIGIVYARQSYGVEENSLSIAAQVENCVKWAERNGVSVLGVYTDSNSSSELYDDSLEGRAYSLTDKEYQIWEKKQLTKGRKRFRKGLADAFAMLEKVDFFIVNEATRFFRNPSPLCGLDNYCFLKLKSNNVALVEVESNKIDTIKSNVDLSVRKLLAAYEMEKLESRKTASMEVVRRKNENGIVFSNAFSTVWKDKKVYFDKGKIEVVKYVFNSIIQGKTYAEILYTLNKEFLEFTDGKCFYESNIYNIVKNPIFCGFHTLKDGKLVKCLNVIDAPINILEWQKANEIVKDKKEKSGKQKYNVKGKKQRFFLPLSGYLRCGHCGSKLTMLNDKGIVYFCKKTVLLKDKECTPSRIRFFFNVDDDDLLLTLQPLFLISLLQDKYELNKLKNIEVKEEELIAQKENIKKVMNTMFEMFSSSELSEEIFKEKIKAKNEELKEIEKRLIVIQSQKEVKSDVELEKLIKEYDMLRWAEKRLDDDTYSRLLRKTIEEIIVYSEEVKIVLKDGNSFNLPRIKNGRSKVLPLSTAKTIIDMKTNDGIAKQVITFTCGKEAKKEVCLLETKTYKIILIK